MRFLFRIPLFPFGEGFDGAPREWSECPRWLKMSPREPHGAQDDLHDGSREPQMAQYGFEDAPISLRDSNGGLQEAKTEVPKTAPKRARMGLPSFTTLENQRTRERRPTTPHNQITSQ